MSGRRPRPTARRRPRAAVLLAAVLITVAPAASAACGPTDAAGDAPATTVVSGDLTIGDAYVGSYGATTAAAYVRISNGGGEDRLMAVSSPGAGSVTPMGAMSVDGSSTGAGSDLLPLVVPAGGAVSFEPGGAHLMVEGLPTPPEPGATVVLHLTFEHAPPVDVRAKVVDVADIPDLIGRS